MTATAPSKVCIVCHQDCSARPRTKDPSGRYTCKDCLDRAASAKLATATAPLQPPEPTVKPSRPAPAATGQEFISLDDDPSRIMSAANAQPRACVNCAMILGPNSIICARCGYNTETGMVLGTFKKAGAGRKCAKCGYDLTGLKTPKCPECGTVNRPLSKQEQLRKDSRALARREYLRPVILFAVALGIVLALTAAVGGRFSISEYLLVYAISVPVGIVVYLMCCALWMGSDAPLGLTALRLAAVFALGDIAVGMAAFVPLLYLQIAMIVAVYGVLIHKLMDLDLQDAMIVGVVTSFTRYGVFMAIAHAMQDGR